MKNWVDRICEDYDITKYQLGKLTGLRDTWYGNCARRGTKLQNIKFNNALKIANILGISAERLLERYGEKEEIKHRIKI
ncbi:hypothetical protein [Haloplasma contractile]|nr:hypothetical protein [Haloplasma contractile]